MRLILLYAFMALGIAIVFYFSWIPQPRLSLTNYLPDWLSHWTDENANMNTRTAIPFIFLGCILASWLLTKKRIWYSWIEAWLWLVAIVVIAEVGQLLLPLRHFDWADIAWGAVGSAVSMLSFSVLALFVRQAKSLF